MSSNTLAIYQNDEGAFEISVDAREETIWVTQKQLADVFGVDVRTVNEHIENVYKTGELDKDSTIRKFRRVQREGGREVKRDILHYNLDTIISVGYKVNSKQATRFRKWATKTLKNYIVDGYSINPKRIEHNKSHFIKAMEDMKLLATDNKNVGSTEATDLSVQFARTWFSLDAYDKSDLPKSGVIKQQVSLKASQLSKAIQQLKTNLIDKGKATDLFAQEKNKNSLEGLFGNVFQSFDGQDLYPTLEEKAAQLLYFVVKNHIFNDGNKRSGAFAFVWFLKEVGLLNITEISPQALTAITLLIAESNPKEKEKMVGLVLLMLGVENE